MTAKPTYRTASYLIEPHPQEPDDLYVTIDVCSRCGAIVHDIMQHDAWHLGVQMRQKPRKHPAMTPEPPTYGVPSRPLGATHIRRPGAGTKEIAREETQADQPAARER
jgi:hypothetical protein